MRGDRSIDRSISTESSGPIETREIASRCVARVVFVFGDCCLDDIGVVVRAGYLCSAWCTLLIKEEEEEEEEESRTFSLKTPGIPEGLHEEDAGKTRGSLSNSQAAASYGTLQPPGVLRIRVTVDVSRVSGRGETN